ncbi:GTPase Era [Patescibacteria group bacterium]|nr:GTPase Era [Patescibacteria group bacterium]
MKSGFVAIIGRSNVGKSTLMNTMVGSKVAITTPKPQTTRRPIQGVVTRPEGQIVFVDTPGIMQNAKDVLTKKLLDYAKDSLRDIDAIVYVVDPTRAMGDEEKQALKMIENHTKPKLLVINKMDDPDRKHFIDYYRDLANQFDAYAEVSALNGKNIDVIERWLLEKMPEGEMNYPEFQLTNLSNEDWMAELIREKLFLRLREEIPYTTHVEVDEITRREDGIVYVHAIIFTNNDRYRPMIIGKGGRGIKEIGQSTRRELETVSGDHYYLDLEVQTDARWIGKFE